MAETLVDDFLPNAGIAHMRLPNPMRDIGDLDVDDNMPAILDDNEAHQDIRQRTFELNALRRSLRRTMASAVIYKPSPSINVPLDIIRGRTLRVRTAGINLMHILHLTAGAKTWRSLTERGRIVVTTFLNAVANAAGKKKITDNTKKKDEYSYPEVVLFVETLFAPPSDEFPGRHKVVGYRLLVNFYIEERRLLDNYHLKRRLAKLPKNDAITVDEAYGLWYPLSRGFMRSFEEVKYLNHLIYMARSRANATRKAAAVNTRRKKKTTASVVIDPDTDKPLPLVLDEGVDIESMMTYMWLKFSDSLEFHYGVVNKYVQPNNYIVGEEKDLCPGRILDPRPYVYMDGSHDNDARHTAYDHPDNPINIDTIYNKESMMNFYAHDHRHLPAIDPNQTMLDLYAKNPAGNNQQPQQQPVPDAESDSEDPSVSGEEEEEHVVAPVVDDNEPMPDAPHLVDSDGEEVEELLDDDEADQMNRDLAADGPIGPVALPYQLRLRDHILLGLEDTLFPQFPYPGTTYRVNDNMIFAETFALLSLPHVLGEFVSDEQALHNHNWPGSDPAIALKRQLAAVLTLKRLEEIRRSVESRTYNTQHEVYQQAMESSAEYRHLVTTNFKNLVDTMAPHTITKVINDQRITVAQAITREGSLVTDGKHPVLFLDSRDSQSTYDYMGLCDFLPDDDKINGGLGSSGTSASIRRYLSEHMRTAFYVQTQFRENGNAGDPMAYIDDIDAIGAPAEELLAQAEERQRVNAQIEMSANEMHEHVSKYVDTVDADFEKRDDILAFRIKCQTSLGLLAHTSKEELNGMDSNAHIQRMAFAMEVRDTVWSQRLTFTEEVLSIMQESNNIPESLMGEYRSFWTKFCNAAGVASVYGNNAKAHFDHKPFVNFIQLMNDDLFGICKASPQSFRALMAAIFSSLDAHTFGIARSEPAINLLLIGDTGIGKSFILRVVEALASPATTRHFTNVTANTFNTETSFDNVLLVFEEMKSRWLYMSDDAKDKGASDELNFLKDRLTRFFTSTDSWFRDDATGRRSVVKSRSSHQNSILGASNQDLTKMDRNVGRRFVLWFVPKQLGTDNVNPDDSKVFDMFESSQTGKTAICRQQMVHALYVTVRNLMKAGVLPPPPIKSAHFYLQCILQRMQKRGIDTSGSTKFHQVLQLAENIQLYFACWMGLFSPQAKEFHAQPDAPDPFSAESILKMVTPWIPVGKDAVIYATTLFDFIYAPSYVEHTIRDLALDGLHFDDPSQWRFRATPGLDKKAKPIYDVNYLELSGRTKYEVLTRIAGYNKEYKMREDEIKLILKEFKNRFMIAPVMTIADTDMVTGKPTSVVRDTTKLGNFPVLGFEKDPMVTNIRARRVYVLIAFLEKYLNVNALDDDKILDPLTATAAELAAEKKQKKKDKDEGKQMRQMKDLRATDNFYKNDEFTLEKAAKMTVIEPGYSVIMDSIREVFSNPINEKIPMEKKFKPNPRIFEYITSYMPKTITIEYEHKRDKMHKRVPFHGISMMINILRNKKVPILRQYNHSISLETTKKHLESLRDPRNQAENRRAEQIGETTAIAMGKFDMDYTTAAEYMRQVCHPGLPFALNYLKLPEVAHKYMAHTHPLGCNSIGYQLAREIAKKNGGISTMRYPLDNTFGRVRDYFDMMRGSLDPKHERTRDVHDMIGNGSFAGITFVAPFDAITGKAVEIAGVNELNNALNLTFEFSGMDEDESAADGEESTCSDNEIPAPVVDDEIMEDADYLDAMARNMVRDELDDAMDIDEVNPPPRLDQIVPIVNIQRVSRSGREY